MVGRKFQCISCDSVLSSPHRFSKLIVCDVCGSTRSLEFANGDVKVHNNLIPFPPLLRVGIDVAVRRGHFKVLGRVRFRYERGFWDEWLLAKDRSDRVWLRRFEGDFTVYAREVLHSPVSEARQGGVLSIGEREIRIETIEVGVVVGVDGQIEMSPNERREIVLGRWKERSVSLEKGADGVFLGIGDRVSPEEIILPLPY